MDGYTMRPAHLNAAAADVESAMDAAEEIVARRFGRRWQSDQIVAAELQIAAMICGRMTAHDAPTKETNG